MERNGRKRGEKSGLTMSLFQRTRTRTHARARERAGRLRVLQRLNIGRFGRRDKAKKPRTDEILRRTGARAGRLKRNRSPPPSVTGLAPRVFNTLPSPHPHHRRAAANATARMIF